MNEELKALLDSKANDLFDEVKEDFIEECHKNGGHNNVRSTFYLHFDKLLEFSDIEMSSNHFYTVIKDKFKDNGMHCNRESTDYSKDFKSLYITFVVNNMIAANGNYEPQTIQMDVLLDDEYLGEDKLNMLAESNAVKCFRSHKDQIKEDMSTFVFTLKIEKQYHLPMKRKKYVKVVDRVIRELLKDAGVVIKEPSTIGYNRNNIYDITMIYDIKKVEVSKPEIKKKKKGQKKA